MEKVGLTRTHPIIYKNQYEGANTEEKWQRFMGDIEQLPPGI